MSLRCRLCTEYGRCARCRRRERIDRSKSRSRAAAQALAREIIRLACFGHPGDDPWLLADDVYAASGRIDRQAVSVAVYGLRQVRLTNGERELAAAAIIRYGGTVREICVRLSLPSIVREEDVCQPERIVIVKISGNTLGCAG